jgi:hypothetical protein
MMAKLGVNRPTRSEKRRLEAMLNDRQPIVDKCKDFEGRICEHIDDEKCEVYINPAQWWKNGNCPMGTHVIKKDTKKETTKTVTGRASKRKNR